MRVSIPYLHFRMSTTKRNICYRFACEFVELSWKWIWNLILWKKLWEWNWETNFVFKYFIMFYQAKESHKMKWERSEKVSRNASTSFKSTPGKYPQNHPWTALSLYFCFFSLSVNSKQFSETIKRLCDLSERARSNKIIIYSELCVQIESFSDMGNSFISHVYQMMNQTVLFSAMALMSLMCCAERRKSGWKRELCHMTERKQQILTDNGKKGANIKYRL